jgi:DNA-directed RNA polymerase subunit RPC12/RpoP
MDFSYAELLNCTEWKEVRKKILTRDIYKCKTCKSSYQESIWNLHIHHTYYINERLPWQYDETCFETLCWSCHKKFHQEQSVIVYVEIDGQLVKKHELVACYRCGSTGYFPQYSHVEHGVCFRCRGARFENFINRNKKIYSSQYSPHQNFRI